MASLFPGAVDTFANPVYTKVDGIDVVQAAHVNDLQDATRAVQELLIVGATIDYTSNNFIADNSSFKLCIETLDDNLGTLSSDFNDHRTFALVTDPAQHHANVIAVDPLGNLSSSRVQPALYELQADIDNLLGVGTLAPVATLDYRYVETSGAQTMQGPLTITLDLSVEGSSVLGNAGGDTHTMTGSFNLTGDMTHTGNTTTTGSIFLDAGQRIAETASPNDSYILFESDRIEMYSHKDFIFRLDADDATDALSQTGEFLVKDGLDNTIFTLLESGDLSVLTSISSPSLLATTSATIGGDLVATNDKLDLGSEELHIQLDKTNTQASSRFFITQDGDTGVSLASADLLLNLDETATLITGRHVLKSGVNEIGYFGMQLYSDNAGGVFYGNGVNFKQELTNSPSSVTLTVDENVNAQNISVTNINKYGFFWEFDSVAVGAVKVRGTYETVGN